MIAYFRSGDLSYRHKRVEYMRCNYNCKNIVTQKYKVRFFKRGLSTRWSSLWVTPFVECSSLGRVEGGHDE